MEKRQAEAKREKRLSLRLREKLVVPQSNGDPLSPPKWYPKEVEGRGHADAQH